MNIYWIYLFPSNLKYTGYQLANKCSIVLMFIVSYLHSLHDFVVTIQSTNNVYASHTVMLKVRNITTKNPEFTWFQKHLFYTGETIKNNTGWHPTLPLTFCLTNFFQAFFAGNCPDCIKLNIKYSKEYFLSNWVIDRIKPNWDGYGQKDHNMTQVYNRIWTLIHGRRPDDIFVLQTQVENKWHCSNRA